MAPKARGKLIEDERNKEADVSDGIKSAPPSSSNLGDIQAIPHQIGNVGDEHGHDFNKISVNKEAPPTSGGWVKKGEKFTWVGEDECIDGVLCEDAVAAVKGANLVIYGSQGSNDITEYGSNEKGMVDTFELSRHHDFSNAFEVKDGEKNKTRFLDAQRAKALLNATGLYHDIYPKDSPFVLTGGSNSEGESEKPSKSHKSGTKIDGRYFGAKGEALISKEACKDADPERMQTLFLAFELQKSGLDAPLTGAPDRFGLKDIDESLKSIHCNHVHFQNNYPTKKPHSGQENGKGASKSKSSTGKKKRKGK